MKMLERNLRTEQEDVRLERKMDRKSEHETIRNIWN
jgi:hypothetical protein